MKVRQANIGDAAEIAGFLEELARLGKRNIPSDQDFVRTTYIDNADNICCLVAVDDNGEILGVQVLKLATPGNDYGVTPGWGIIGTHVKASAARRGVGRALFTATRSAAAGAGLKKIDATIGAGNAEGLAYYEAVGFYTHEKVNGRVSKCFDVV